MPKKNKVFTIVSVTVLVFGLLLVRAFEQQLFYDPFLVYFSGEYLTGDYPLYDGVPLLLGLMFRFWLNTLLSLGIIFLLFRDLKLLRFSLVLYVVFFVLLLAAFFGLLHFSDSNSNFLLFYIRRFLIQPLFLLLFVPAFYYQKQVSKK